MCASRVYVSRDLRPPLSSGQGPVTSRKLGTRNGVPLGTPWNWEHRFGNTVRMVNHQVVEALDSHYLSLSFLRDNQD
jgi:hypothetical protein